ncbi:interleukin 17a/f1 [Myxocyprinus asiaticus]|uniref:interleukin 17a/f1 n=1 Tax=Myxocyprinus asiaticus TaxID=70543 RepID=UPI002223ADC2|nr:interleukin 17a/f1 [Myxocyprinus asiaticus]
MSSPFNIQFLMVACMMGLLLISLGVEGAPSKKVLHKTAEESDPSSYRLILDSQFKPSSNPIRPINNDSISPWIYTFIQDKDLYPSKIAEAKCLLTGCLNIRNEEDNSYESKPIYRQILILRRVRGDKHNYSFKLEYKTIAVGCTCVRPYTEEVRT